MNWPNFDCFNIGATKLTKKMKLHLTTIPRKSRFFFPSENSFEICTLRLDSVYSPVCAMEKKNWFYCRHSFYRINSIWLTAITVFKSSHKTEKTWRFTVTFEASNRLKIGSLIIFTLYITFDSMRIQLNDEDNNSNYLQYLWMFFFLNANDSVSYGMLSNAQDSVFLLLVSVL